MLDKSTLNKRKIIKTYINGVTLVMVVTMFMISTKVFASTSDINGIGYGYRLIKPSNQREGSEYFDLLMTPKQKQVIELELFNLTNSPMDIEMSLNSAKTNSNGEVVYGPSTIKIDSSLKYNIETHVEIPEKVTLAAYETKKVEAVITMPEKKFEGYMSGGIYFKKIEKNILGLNTGFNNEYAFIIGLLLSEGKVNIQPDLRFKEFSVGMNHYEAAFFSHFSNITAEYIESMAVSTKIYKKNDNQVTYEFYQRNFRMAPNSQIAFPIPVGNNRIESGQYRGKVTVSIKGKEWEWTDEFTVSEKESKELNEQAVTPKYNGLPFWGTTILISVLLGYLVINKIIKFLVKKQLKEDKRINKSN